MEGVYRLTYVPVGPTLGAREFFRFGLNPAGRVMVRAASLLSIVMVVGCQRGPEPPSNLPPLFPLRVTVLQEGTPVPGAFVRLLPSGQSTWSCGATTDANGVAAIKTIGEFDGAPEGSYKVLISKLDMPPSTGTDLSNLDAPVKEGASESVNLIDPKYSLPNKTPLQVEVSEGSPEATFDVGAAVRSVVKGPRS